MQLKVLLIDDEPKAIITLDAMLKEFVENVNIVGTANNALEGIKLIRKFKPDLVFLDINMPNLDGFDLLELLETRDFKVVITSGHEKHALRAIKNKVDDFLLKPINLEELEKVVHSIAKDLEKGSKERLGLIKLVDKGVTVFIKQDQIKYIHADGRYSEVVSTDKKFLITKNLGEFEEELDKKVFFRVHRSYLINRNFVKNISSSDGGFITLDDGTEIEISR